MAERIAHPVRQRDGVADQFESMTGMTRWLIWLGVMVAVVVIFTIGFLVDPRNEARIVEFALYFVIAGIGIALIVKCYHDVQFLDRETRLASQQVGILEQVDNFDAFFAKADRSVFRSHIENLYTISQSERDFNQDNLIQIVHERLISRTRGVELFASILITLGLIGTIVGLIQMMGSLQTSMADGQTAGLLEKLAQPGGAFGGLTTAFNTTLLGAVLGGIMLRVLGNVVDSNTLRYTAHLAELTEVHVLPYMRKLSRARDTGTAGAA
jgi:hypothetical protein